MHQIDAALLVETLRRTLVAPSTTGPYQHDESKNVAEALVSISRSLDRIASAITNVEYALRRP